MSKVVADDASDVRCVRPIMSVKPSGNTVISTEITPKRQAMLDLIAKWMPTSLDSPRVPPGETQDLLARAGWNKEKGQASKRDSDWNRANPDKPPIPIVTSCGDVLAALLRLWKSDFVGAFGIRDVDDHNKPPGARGRNLYVEPDGYETPKRGDILVLRAGVGPSSAGSVGHVGILVDGTAKVWQTADGGGGSLPNQTAMVTQRNVKLTDDGIPILVSPTDGKEKQLDGWIVLERMNRQT